MKKIIFAFAFFIPFVCLGQLKWKNVDSSYQPLPKSVHIFYTNESIDTGAFRAFYVTADLNDKKLDFTTDTSYNRRLTPLQFYQKDNHPVIVVNCTFFSFETNQNLGLIIKNSKLIAYNRQTIIGKGKDTFTYRHVFPSAIGISKHRHADVAWTFTDSSSKKVYASEQVVALQKDSAEKESLDRVLLGSGIVPGHSGVTEPSFQKWKMHVAVGGGPVLLQNGELKITNNEELKFAAKAINDKHPRTAIGYTADHKLIILVVQGRSESSGGATLIEEAKILKDLGCEEALNLDGGGSSCLLANGKETIKPSDKEGERAVPGVFIIKK